MDKIRTPQETYHPLPGDDGTAGKGSGKVPSETSEQMAERMRKGSEGYAETPDNSSKPTKP